MHCVLTCALNNVASGLQVNLLVQSRATGNELTKTRHHQGVVFTVRFGRINTSSSYSSCSITKNIKTVAYFAKGRNFVYRNCFILHELSLITFPDIHQLRNDF